MQGDKGIKVKWGSIVDLKLSLINIAVRQLIEFNASQFSKVFQPKKIIIYTFLLPRVFTQKRSEVLGRQKLVYT